MIQLQFVQGGGLSSQAIAWFSSGHFSHVDIVLPDSHLLGARSDAADGVKGVAIRRPDYELWRRKVIFTIPCTNGQASAAYEFARAQVGKPYDHTAILGFVFDRSWMDSDAWYCSELATRFVQKSGVLGDLYLAANKITPVAAALVMSALPGASWVTVLGGSSRLAPR